MLELNLFGMPQILLAGRLVSGLVGVKSQALLFYLARNGRPHSRLALVGLLWPDKREANALTNLRQSLYQLRTAFPNYLKINRLTVAFNQALPCQIDTVLFEKEMHASNPLTVRQVAVERYTGEFLAGFQVEEAQPFADWVSVTRERLHQVAKEALRHLVTDFIERQETMLGLRYTNQWLTFEPWREEAHRAKMCFLAWTDQQQAAVEHYAQFCQNLAAALHATPAAETVALYEQIHKREMGSGEQPRQRVGNRVQSGFTLAANALQNPQSKIANQVDWGEAPTQVTFYGRQAELTLLNRWLVKERCRLVAILGMGGVGKRALFISHPYVAL